jgi:sugar lactone lactonase YvrE
MNSARLCAILLFLFIGAIASVKGDGTLETVFSDPTYQLCGVAVTPNSRIFVSYPYFQDKHKYSVVEVAKDGTVKPFPDETWNSFKKGEDGKNKFVCVLAVYADNEGFLWIVDPAGIGLGDVYDHAAKVVKVDLKTNQIVRIYRFPDSVAGLKSYLNDIRIDTHRGFAYLTSSSNGGIVVLNIRNGASRFLLHGHPSTTSDPSYHFSPNGKELATAQGPMKINSDGIALSPDGQWLYYKPLTDDKLYRVKASLLRDFTTPEKQVEAGVQDLGHFVATDGMEMDHDGNLYVGDIENDRIVKISPDLKMTTLVQDKDKLIWPDSYSIANGFLYISCSQIKFMPWFNNGSDLTHFPYQLYRLKLNLSLPIG